jgi:hypothetical protein
MVAPINPIVYRTQFGWSADAFIIRLRPVAYVVFVHLSSLPLRSVRQSKAQGTD